MKSCSERRSEPVSHSKDRPSRAERRKGSLWSILMHHVIPTLMILSAVLAGCAHHDRHIAAALEHADQAITNGQEGDNNALAEQATVALRYARLAERNSKDGRLHDAIRLLKDGIQHARYGRSVDGVQAVKDAYKLLAQIQ